MHGIRFPMKTALLTTLLLAFAGTAAGQTLDGAANAATDHATAASDLGLHENGASGALDGALSHEHASGSALADAGVDGVRSETGPWAWLTLHLGAFVAKIGDLFAQVGLAAPATDADADLGVGMDGVDVKANVAGVNVDGTNVDADLPEIPQIPQVGINAAGSLDATVDGVGSAAATASGTLGTL